MEQVEERELAGWMSGDPQQAEGTVFQTDENSKRDQGHGAFWVCLRKGRDATGLRQRLSRHYGDMGMGAMQATQNCGFDSG